MDNKTKFIRARVTEKEYKEIKTKAKKAKMNLSSYITKSALDKEIIIIEELKDMVHNISKIGNNINQLTVLAHTERIKVVDLKEFKKALNSIWKELSELTSRTGKRK